jgi:two-component system KDP operon response regulator KdpE
MPQLKHNNCLEENTGDHMPVRILTIDDDPATTDLLTLLLKAQGFDVLAANTGAEAVKMIRDTSPDLILLDLLMPEMDGWQLCKKVREFSNVPILILSVLDNPEMVASALDAGADDYLIKPVPDTVLVAHLHKLTRRAVKHEKARLPVRHAVATS